MTKTKFIRQLSKALRRLKPEERSRYLAYYEEAISDLMENGDDEDSACKKQGSIETITAKIYEDAGTEMLRKRDWAMIILLIIGTILTVISVLCMFLLPDAGAISVLDGDGPVSVFVAGKIGEPMVLYIVSAVVIIAGLLYSCIRKRKTGIIISIVIFVLFSVGWLIHGTEHARQKKEADAQNTVEENGIDNSNFSDGNFIGERTKEIIRLVEDGDYDTLADTYATEEMRQYLTDDYMSASKNMISDDWGEYRFMGAIYTQEIRENGVDYTVAQVTVTYEKVSVTYTITYDSEFMLAGLFIK